MTTPPDSRLRANNFDLIRLVLAGIVAIVHVEALSDEPALAWIPNVLSSALAVKSFFVVSGFLIVMSYERSASWRAYAEKRVRRLYPAYAVVILGTALLLAAASTAPVTEFYSVSWFRYVGSNLIFLNFVQPTLPGVFEANRVTEVNGALWTLKIEVLFYAIVPVLVLLVRRFGWAAILTLTYVSSVAYVAVCEHMLVTTGEPVYEVLARQLPGQLSYFVAGSALYYAFAAFERRMTVLAGMALLVLVIDQVFPLPAVEPAALGVAVVAAAFAKYIGGAGRYGDFSYGLYILHFPVIQVMVEAGWFRGRPLALMVVALSSAVFGAVLLWHLVEKRWLLPSSHYRRAPR